MPVLVETDNIVIRRDTLDETIINIVPIWISFLFDNDEILYFRDAILNKSSNDEFQVIDCETSMYIEGAHWALHMPINVFNELKLALELAPVDKLIPSDFKTIKLIDEENKSEKDNLIYFQVESMRRKK